MQYQTFNNVAVASPPQPAGKISQIISEIIF